MGSRFFISIEYAPAGNVFAHRVIGQLQSLAVSHLGRGAAYSTTWPGASPQHQGALVKSFRQDGSFTFDNPSGPPSSGYVLRAISMYQARPTVLLARRRTRGSRRVLRTGRPWRGLRGSFGSTSLDTDRYHGVFWFGVMEP